MLSVSGALVKSKVLPQCDVWAGARTWRLRLLTWRDNKPVIQRMVRKKSWMKLIQFQQRHSWEGPSLGCPKQSPFALSHREDCVLTIAPLPHCPISLRPHFPPGPTHHRGLPASVCLRAVCDLQAKAASEVATLFAGTARPSAGWTLVLFGVQMCPDITWHPRIRSGCGSNSPK